MITLRNKQTGKTIQLRKKPEYKFQPRDRTKGPLGSNKYVLNQALANKKT